jgi:hypothetical protein
MREKAWSMLLATVHWRPGNNHLGIQIVHNWLRKSHTPFVKVVEDQGIYNFAIHCSDHFCSTFSSFGQSNRATWKNFGHPALQTAARRRAPSCALPPPLSPPWAWHGRRGPTGSTRLAQGDWTVRPPPLLGIPLMPRAVRTLAGRAAVRRPSNGVVAVPAHTSPPYHAHAATWPSW